MKRIGLVTSGGDAPGMNACIRAVVRTAIHNNLEVIGIQEGYEGLIEGKTIPLDSKSVGGIINLGGTILKTVRSERMRTTEGLNKAVRNLKQEKIEGLIAIGGDGSMCAANQIYQKIGIPVVGIPATIDNDIFGTDETIGFDTALDTAIEAIDKIRDNATSHNRGFIIEVMGRQRGFLALAVGVAAGAEIILIPEIKYDLQKICDILEKGHERGKKSTIIVMAEGAGSSFAVAHHIKDITGYEMRTSVLGYIQRGGSPSTRSRILAALFGYRAVITIKRAKNAYMVGIENNHVVTHPLEYVLSQSKPINKDLYHLAQVLS